VALLVRQMYVFDGYGDCDLFTRVVFTRWAASIAVVCHPPQRAARAAMDGPCRVLYRTFFDGLYPPLLYAGLSGLKKLCI